MYFASGVLISVTFLIVVPKSFLMNEYGPVYLLAGFLGIFLINQFVDVYLCHREEACRDFRIGIVAAFGIAFHSFVDGIIFATTYTVSVFIGVMATLGMIFHEFPEGCFDFFIVHERWFWEREVISLFIHSSSYHHSYRSDS